MIYNKFNNKLDMNKIRDRHDRILKKIEVQIEQKPPQTPLLKENGHFNWNYLDDEFYFQKNLNEKEFLKLDKKLLKKLYCEFLFLNENQLKDKKINVFF